MSVYRTLCDNDVRCKLFSVNYGEYVLFIYVKFSRSIIINTFIVINF